MTQTARGSSPEDRRGTSSPRTGAGGATVSQTARFDTLWTGRLLMRRWQDSDREPFAGLNGDPETMLFFPAPLSRAASDALIDRIESCFDDLGYGLWALEVAATGEFIGFTGLNPMPDDVPGAGGVEVGWRLAKRAWHHGYATEAARAALQFGFETLKLDEIVAFTVPANQSSWTLMERLGMTHNLGGRPGTCVSFVSITGSEVG